MIGHPIGCTCEDCRRERQQQRQQNPAPNDSPETSADSTTAVLAQIGAATALFAGRQPYFYAA